MAIPSYSFPADAGVPCLILVYAAIALSTVKRFFVSILRGIGIPIKSREAEAQLSLMLTDSSSVFRVNPSLLYIEKFRTQAVWYGSIPESLNKDCSFCLTEFQQNAVVNRLSCGHVFHKKCLEEWLNHEKTKCPLCRNYMVPQDKVVEARPM